MLAYCIVYTNLMSLNITSNSTGDEEFTGLNEGVLWSGVGAVGLFFIWYIYCKIKGCIDRKGERELELWLQRRHAPPIVKETPEKKSSCCPGRA